jgi:hypothetical protein
VQEDFFRQDQDYLFWALFKQIFLVMVVLSDEMQGVLDTDFE